jgi:tripartite-type tricarboxylate transporter receptor subunit TctC
MRQLITAILTMAAVFTLPATAWAKYPDHPLRLVVSFPAGSGSDFVGRLISAEMAKTLGQPIIVENRDGAQTIIGMHNAAQSAPDGYTLVLFGSTPAAINVSMYKHLPYDPIKDFTPIGLIGPSPLVLVASLDRPYKTLAELVAYGRANPGKLNFGYSSTAIQVGMSAIRQRGGFKATTVGYRGTPQVLIDLMSGQIDASLLDYPFALTAMKSHKIRVLGVTSKERFPLSPEIAPVASNLPGYELSVFTGFAAAGKIPDQAKRALSDALTHALKEQAISDKLARQGIAVKITTPDEFGVYVQDQIKQWADLIKAAGIAPQD